MKDGNNHYGKQVFIDGIQGDIIDEMTSGSGVTVDGCLIKDGYADADRIVDINVDDAAIADDRVLAYDLASGTLIYVDQTGGAAIVEIQEDDVKVTDADTINFEGGGGKVTDEGGGKVTVDITPGAGGVLIEIQEDDVKVADADTVNFEGGGGKVTDEGGGKVTVDITLGTSGSGAPTDYPYAGFGTSGSLTAEVNLYDFYGKNLIKNSPGQIVTDGTEPQWWDDVANATLTDVDLAGEAIAEKAKRAFKAVTIADNVYGYQTLTFADEDLLDAGETMVSLGVWVYCASAAKASIGLYGTNLGLQESSQAGAGVWTLLKVEGITLNAGDTSIQVRLIVDTDTAWFTMPMLNVGPKALPWVPRGWKRVQLQFVTQVGLGATGDVAWSDTDCTANSHPLAVWYHIQLYCNDVHAAGSNAIVSHDDVFGADVAIVRNRELVANQYQFFNGDVQCNDSQVIRYYYDEPDADNDGSIFLYLNSYWMWE